MITFKNIEYLVPLAFTYLLLGLWANRNRQRVIVASSEQVVKSNSVSRLMLGIPLFCWFVLSFLLAAALANPQTDYVISYIKAKSKKAMLSVDASASMGEGKQGSTMDKIKVMLQDFATLRIDKGDFVGISAYSGQTNSSRGFGYARVIQYPTQDPEVVNAAIGSLRPSMFGHYSAIGDGILVAVISLIEPQAREALGDSYDRKTLEDNIWSIGTRNEDVAYAQKIASAIGKQTGQYIVLFTDGKFNTGLDPACALWFAERLGLKVHFIAFESSAATGLSSEEQLKRKAWTIRAVHRTGGTYKESSDIDGVAMLLQEIDDAEKVDVTIEEERRRKSRRKLFTYGAVIAFGALVLSWVVWSDPL
jgi:hypothetical protein